MNIKKKKRLEGDIQRLLSQGIQRVVKDPRLGELINVTEVSITEDIKYAKVYVSVIGSEEERTQSIAILNKASGHIRKFLSGALTVRYTPELQFVLDKGIENTIRINQLLQSLNESEETEDESTE